MPKFKKPIVTRDGRKVVGIAPADGIRSVAETVRHIERMIGEVTKGAIPYVMFTDRSCIGDVLEGEELQALGRLLKVELKGGENVFELAVKLKNQVN